MFWKIDNSANHMKLGRYEFGGTILFIALFVAGFPALKFFYTAQLFNTIPVWLFGTFYMIVVYVWINLYIHWFLHYVCVKKIYRWINQHGFTYTVGGFLDATAHIQGRYQNRPVVIELWYGAKNQTSWIKCKVKNPNKASFTLSRRYLLTPSIKKGNPIIDPYFYEYFWVKPTSTEIFSNTSLTDQLIEIQETTNVIDEITLDKNKIFLATRQFEKKG